MQLRKTEPFKTEGNTLSGYAVVYNTDSVEIYEGGRRFKEQIRSGAFDESIKNNDIKLYFNHDKSMPLARTKNGSLKVRSDEKGVWFEATLPDTSLARDVKELLNTGTLTGEMSFGFIDTDVDWKSRNEKIVKKGILREVSVVMDAAYQDTHSQLRSIHVNQDQEINNKRIQLIRRRTK